MKLTENVEIKTIKDVNAFLFGVVLGTILIDYLETIYGIGWIGAEEINPISRGIMDIVPLHWFIGLTIVVLLKIVLIYGIWRYFPVIVRKLNQSEIISDVCIQWILLSSIFATSYQIYLNWMIIA